MSSTLFGARDTVERGSGELLVSEGVLSAEELEDALAAQRRTQPRKPLGELLLASGIVSPPLLVRLSAQQCQVPDAPADKVPAAPPVAAPAPVSPGPRLLGELFVAQGLLTPEQLEWALAEQAETGRLLGEVVVQNGLVSMVALVNALVEQLRDTPER